MTIRTVATLLSIEFIPFLRNRDFQPRTVTRTRLDHEIAANGPNSLFDHRRAAVEIIQFSQSQPTAEREPLSIVVDYQLPQPVLCPKTDVYRSGLAVLANVDQAFLNDTHKFAARRGRQSYLLQFGNEAHVHTSVVAKTFYELSDKVKKLLWPNFHRLHA